MLGIRAYKRLAFGKYMTNSHNKISIKNLEDFSDHLESITKNQNLLFNKIQKPEDKVIEILEILKTKQYQTNLDKLNTQVSKLNLGTSTSQPSTSKSSNKIVLAKPRK